MNKNRKPQRAILGSSLVLGLSLAGAAYGIDLNKVLVENASQLNENLPMMIDSETRLDSSIGLNRTFRYNYTLINYASEDVDSGVFRQNIESKLVNMVCTTKEMDVFVDNDIPVIYAYYGKHGKQIATITVESHQCES